MKNNTKSDDDQEHYIVCVGSAIIDGPRIDSDTGTLKEFFDEVKKYNEEQGSEVVRVYVPKPKKVNSLTYK